MHTDMALEEAITIDTDGEYINLNHDGNIRVSVSEKWDEILVYEDGQCEPTERFTLDGERQL